MGDRAVLRALVDAVDAHLDRFGRVDLGDAHVTALRDDLGDAELARLGAQAGHAEQRLELLGQLAVAVGQLLGQVLEILLGARRRQLAVRLEPQLVGVDVVHRDRRLDRQVDRHGHRLGAFGLLVLLDRLGHHADVQVEADALDVPGLLVAEQVAGAAQLQVLHRHVESGAERRVLRDRRQAVVRLLGQRLGRIVQEVCVRALAAAADAPAQLVQLREAEAVGSVDDQRVRVGDIQTGLDDRRAHEHVDVAMPEVADDLVELLLPHLAVRDADARLGHELVDLRRRLRDVLHAVVHVEHLSPAQQLAAHRGRDLRVLVCADVSEHGKAVLRRRGQRGHLADAGHRHLQRARDGRGRQRQHVDVGAQGLERLLVLDAEALLLVDDDQTEILELDLRVQQLVRADDDVDAAALQPLDGLVDLLGGLEPAHGGDRDRKSLVTLGEGLVVLLDEQRRRHEHGDLLAVLDGLEGGAHGDLGLAEADVAADQAVHRDRLFHVGLDLVDGGELVGGLLVRERVLQLLLPRGVGAEREAGGALAGRIQLDQVLGDLVDVLAGLRLGSRPVGAAELVELRGLRADVLADLVELVGRDEQLVGRCAAFARRVFDDQVFARRPVGAGADGALAHADEPADAVLLVHHVVAGLQLHQVDGLAAALRRFRLAGGGGAAGQVAFGEQRDLGRRVDEAVDGLRADHREAGDAGLVDRALEPRERAGRGGGDGDVDPLADEPLDAARGLRLVAAVCARVGRCEADVAGQARVDAEARQSVDVVVGVFERADRLVEVEEARPVEADRRAGAVARCGHMPACGEELVRGLGQVLGGTAQLLRVGEHHDRALVQHAGHRLHVVHERGHQGFHALDRNRVGDRFEHILGVRDLADQPPRAAADRLGELQLAAGGGPDRALGLAVGALVGGVELPDRVDLVAEELDAHRVGRGRREHVDDAAAHREFAAVHDQIDARVRVFDQTAGRLVERQLLAGREHERLHVAQATDHGLDERTDRHDEDADRAEHRIRPARVRQAAEHGHAVRHGVGARAQPLMRQRLPRLELRDVVRIAAVPRAQRVHGVLGLAARGDDEHDRPSGGHGGGQSRPQARGGADDDRRVGGRRVVPVDAPGGQRMEGRIGVEPFQDARQRSVDQGEVPLARGAVRLVRLIGH